MNPPKDTVLDADNVVNDPDPPEMPTFDIEPPVIVNEFDTYASCTSFPCQVPAAIVPVLAILVNEPVDPEIGTPLIELIDPLVSVSEFDMYVLLTLIVPAAESESPVPAFMQTVPLASGKLMARFAVGFDNVNDVATPFVVAPSSLNGVPPST